MEKRGIWTIDLIGSVVYNIPNNGLWNEPRSVLLKEELDETGKTLSSHGRDPGAGAAIRGGAFPGAGLSGDDPRPDC